MLIHSNVNTRVYATPLFFVCAECSDCFRSLLQDNKQSNVTFLVLSIMLANPSRIPKEQHRNRPLWLRLVRWNGPCVFHTVQRCECHLMHCQIRSNMWTIIEWHVCGLFTPPRSQWISGFNLRDESLVPVYQVALTQTRWPPPFMLPSLFDFLVPYSPEV
jgi:hypothetical protein